jgi:hypothetical protein
MVNFIDNDMIFSFRKRDLHNWGMLGGEQHAHGNICEDAIQTEVATTDSPEIVKVIRNYRILYI